MGTCPWVRVCHCLARWGRCLVADEGMAHQFPPLGHRRERLVSLCSRVAWEPGRVTLAILLVAWFLYQCCSSTAL